MQFWQRLYSTALLPAFLAGAHVLALKNSKVRATLAGRNGLWQRLSVQAAARRSAPLVWFHVASAGEYLQATPVMERLMAAGYQCALTVTSVSGYQWATKRVRPANLVLVDYLPFDTRRNAARLIDLLKPAALVYVKFDLWPNLIWEARRTGVPQFLISATLQAGSKRLNTVLGRSLYRTVYSAIDAIYAVANDDARRFLATAPGHAHVEVLGDTRFDSVLDRRATLKPPPLPDFVSQGPVLVLGSMWLADEQRVLPVVREALRDFPTLTCIVAPHEVDEYHLRTVEAVFNGLPVQRLKRLAPAGTERCRVILVDTVGQLSALYHYATAAYVGGAFGRGVHNVMEPSAMGAVTVCGPFYQNSPEAAALIAQGKCFSVKDGPSFRAILYRWLNNPQAARALGSEARRYIEAQAGAAERCYERITHTIEREYSDERTDARAAQA